MKMEKVKVEELNSPKWNPRDISDEELLKLKKSFNKFGYIQPLIVNKNTMNIIGGNQRLEVLKEVGFNKVDVVMVDLETEEDEKALNIALNKISGEFNMDLLGDLMKDLNLADYDLNITGFDEIELEELDIDLDEPLIEEDNDDELLDIFGETNKSTTKIINPEPEEESEPEPELNEEEDLEDLNNIEETANEIKKELGEDIENIEDEEELKPDIKDVLERALYFITTHSNLYCTDLPEEADKMDKDKSWFLETDKKLVKDLEAYINDL